MKIVEFLLSVLIRMISFSILVCVIDFYRTGLMTPSEWARLIFYLASASLCWQTANLLERKGQYK